MLVTHNGRLLKTVKLNNNLLEVTNSGRTLCVTRWQ